MNLRVILDGVVSSILVALAIGAGVLCFGVVIGDSSARWTDRALAFGLYLFLSWAATYLAYPLGEGSQARAARDKAKEAEREAEEKARREAIYGG